MVEKTFYTKENDCDGYVVNGHACGYSATNSGTLMYVGTLSTTCLNDNMRDVARSFVSFDTSSIPKSATITDAKVYFYYAGHTKSSKIFMWNAAYTPQVRVNVRSDFIGDEVDTSDYSFGGINIASYGRITFTGWSAGYKEIDCTDYVNKGGDTDFMIYVNQDFEDEMQNDSKYYYLHFNTVETSFQNKDPKLVVTYTVKGRVFTAIIGAS